MAEPNRKRRKMSSSTSQTSRVVHNFDKSDSVTLIVGTQKHEILVHANQITRESEFFKTALKRVWREGQLRTITMPNDDYETMTNYITFVYNCKLPTSHLVGPVCETFTGMEFCYLADLYVLGARLLNKSMKNAAIEEIIRITLLFDFCNQADCPDYDAINIIYNGTCEGDPARRLMVDMYATFGGEGWLGPEYNQTFLLDLAQKLLLRNGTVYLPPPAAAAYLV